MAIVTISGEMGSGGIPIVHKLAEKLGYTLIDTNAIQKKAADYGLTPEAVAKADEKPPSFEGTQGLQVELDFNQIELMVLESALEGDVIIYGRGGQDLLAGIDSVLRARIIAPYEERIERWSEREWLDPELARALVRKSDQQRAGYIKYYYDRDWADPVEYDLVLNTLRITEESVVDLISTAVNDPNIFNNKERTRALLENRILQKRIEIRLVADKIIDGINRYHFSATADDGIVTLEGHLGSGEQCQEVIDAISGMEGVKEVIDDLSIRQARPVPQEH